MRRIALINQKGGVGKTTTAVNLGAALAAAGKRVVLCDLDPQANLTMHLGVRLEAEAPTTYRILLGQNTVEEALIATETPGLSLLPTDIDLSGAELELASSFGRETLLRDAFNAWEAKHVEEHGEEPADYLLIDCPPSLGLLAVNGLATAREVFLVVQTQFFALQGLSKLMEIVELVKSRLHPEIEITGIVPCLYDSRLRLAREVLGELRNYFPGLVFRQTVGTNVKLAEAPSFGQTIFQYAPNSPGARDYRALGELVIGQEASTAESATESDPAVLVPVAPPEPTAIEGSSSSAAPATEPTEQLGVKEEATAAPASTPSE